MMKNNVTYDHFINQLNATKQEERLSALGHIKQLLDSKLIDVDQRSNFTNNHIHTQYSFSPYSPTSAVWHGYRAGLATLGIVDHDSLAGANEFIRAGRILDVPTTIGFEIRTDWSDTKLVGKRLNNPDQLSSAYITVHAIPHNKIDEVQRFLKPIRKARFQRNRKQTEKLNAITAPYGITIDFDQDVIPISNIHDGGTITERHILFAMTHKMINKIGKGASLINFLQHNLSIQLTKRQTEFLLEVDCDMYAYDMLNILKSNFVDKMYINADTREAIPVRKAIAFAKSIHAIVSYCYLGNVDKSPTGDKRPQKFEDDYLEEVLEECVELGFHAVSMMPSRNTSEQLDRVMKLCDQHGFMQISGEDINQPRQEFICKQLGQEAYIHLIDTTWALIGHELATTKDVKNRMFKNKRPDQKDLYKRIEKYKRIAKEYVYED
ncbi:MAG: PHP domain-containing protein [Clostridiales bacterium]|nr:PHP domain-containing protein [Clostridiales bacterium]